MLISIILRNTYIAAFDMKVNCHHTSKQRNRDTINTQCQIVWEENI